MVRPKPCVLFAQSFLHSNLSEYVDEVRFTEPVVICSCEFLELQASSLCPTLSLSGASFPQSFALEIFVRIGGEARFKRLCPSFLYSPSASNILEVQAAVTDHLVIRGSYRALTLVVYGNSVKELGQYNFDHEIDNTLSDAILLPEAVFKPEDLPEALQDDASCRSKVITPLEHLQLAREDSEQSEVIHHLLSLAIQVTNAGVDRQISGKVFDVLVSAVSSGLSQHGFENVIPQWPLRITNAEESRSKLKTALKQALQKMQVINGVLHGDQPQAKLNVSMILETVFDWLQRSIQISSNPEPDFVTEEYIIGGLAVVQFICMDAEWCFQFVIGGGFHLLMSALQYAAAESSATLLLILSALKCACQHAFACEALLGWWPTKALTTDKPSVSIGYCSVLKSMLQTKRQNVAQLASEILRHLHCYQYASEFQCAVEYLVEISETTGGSALSEDILKKLSLSVKGLANSLIESDIPQYWSPAEVANWLILHGDDNAFTLPPNTIFSWISSSKYSFSHKDLNMDILFILQERRFIPSLAALLSVPWMTSATVKFRDHFMKFIGNVQVIILSLVSSRSGLLFLASDQEAANTLIAALIGTEDGESGVFLELRNALSLISGGFVCKMRDLGHMIMTNLSVIGLLDRLLAASQYSESFLWLLWELSVFSRSESGRQALSSISFFPEVLILLVEALQPESHPDIKEAHAINRAVVHSAAEVMQVILKDLFTSSLAAWVPHALSLQKALQYCSPTSIDIAVGSHGLGPGNKDGLCARLLDWVDAAVIFHKKGPVGLLRYAAALVVGSVTSVAVGGLPIGDSVEVDNTIGESAVSTELPTVNTLLGRGVMLGATGTVLPDTAIIQLTVSMRIMASIACHPGMAAVLYGEGAMSIAYILLEYGAGVLQSSTADYDYMVEEDSEEDGITEMFLEQEREQSLLGLLLPTLLLLLSLLKRLQLTGEEYRNTRLVEVLLQLHACVCSRLASKLSWDAGMLVLASVSRVLASALAFWPVLGWTPSLIAKLLGLGTSSLIQTTFFPLEPKEAISVFWILGDMLPIEYPQLCTNKILAMDISRSLAVGTLLGTKCMKSVGWHCEPSECQKLVQAIESHLDTIATMFFHISFTASLLLQALLVKFAVRMACQSPESASALVRPVITFIQEHTASGGAESDISRVEQLLEVLQELARHPATKKVLMREGIVQALLQAGSEQIASGKPEVKPTIPLRILCLITDTFVAICDPNISNSPKSTLHRRLARDCPRFAEYCAIVAWTYNNILVLPFGKELCIMSEAMQKIVSNQLGRAAFAFIALSIKKTPLQISFDSEALEADVKDIRHWIPEGIESFVPFCKRMAAALSETTDVQEILSIIQNFFLSAIQLSAAGRSACGLGALHVLFEMDKMESNEILSGIMDTLKSRVEDSGTCEEPTVCNYRKALIFVNALLRLLNNLPAMIVLEKKVKVIIGGLHTVQSLPDDSYPSGITSPDWTLVPSLLYQADDDVKSDSDEKFDSLYENMFGDKFSWECANDLPEKAAASGTASKRKASVMLDGVNKKHNVDGVIGPMADGTSSANGTLTGRGLGMLSSTSSSRRDTFRQRKPNTSRPPSMHVDDYVARERGNEMSASISVSMNQRSALGGGRPPSIHVDEFMARQRERHVVVGAVPTTVESQPSAPSPLQPPVDTTKTESSTTAVRVRPVLPDEDLHDVDIDLEGVPDADDLLSLPLGIDLVVPTEEGKAGFEVHLSSRIESSRHVSVSGMLPASNISKPTQSEKTPGSAQNAEHPLYAEGNEPIPVLAMPSDSTSGYNLKLQVSQVTEVASTVAVSLHRQEPLPSTTFSAHVLHNGSTASHESASHPQRSHPQFAMAPAPPPPPPPPPIPAGVIPEKYETSSNLNTAAAPMPSIPPPFQRPSGSWQPSDQGHITPMSPATYGTIPVTHTPNPQVNVGGIYPHATVSSWPNMLSISEDMGAGGPGRLAPPLPPTPPPFSSNQTPVVQGPLTSTVMHSPAPYQNVGRNQTDQPLLYSYPSNGNPAPQPHGLPANFQPPLPPGRPNIPQGPVISGSPGQHFHHISQPTAQAAQFPNQTAVPTQSPQLPQPMQQAPMEAPPLHPAQSSQIQESNLLQQILASPEAIQDLLKDQTKLQHLLEQHPKLISLLQEKMGPG